MLVASFSSLYHCVLCQRVVQVSRWEPHRRSAGQRQGCKSKIFSALRAPDSRENKWPGLTWLHLSWPDLTWPGTFAPETFLRLSSNFRVRFRFRFRFRSRLPLRLSWDFPGTCLRLSSGFPQTFLSLCSNFPETLLRLSWDLPESFLSLSWDFPETSLRLSWDLAETFLRPDLTWLDLTWPDLTVSLLNRWKNYLRKKKRRFGVNAGVYWIFFSKTNICLICFRRFETPWYEKSFLPTKRAMYRKLLITAPTAQF